MNKYKKKYRTWIKIIAALVVCLFFVNTIAWAIPANSVPRQANKSTLARWLLTQGLQDAGIKDPVKVAFLADASMRSMRSLADRKLPLRFINVFLRECADKAGKPGDKAMIELLEDSVQEENGVIRARFKVVEENRTIEVSLQNGASKLTEMEPAKPVAKSTEYSGEELFTFGVERALMLLIDVLNSEMKKGDLSTQTQVMCGRLLEVIEPFYLRISNIQDEISVDFSRDFIEDVVFEKLKIIVNGNTEDNKKEIRILALNTVVSLCRVSRSLKMLKWLLEEMSTNLAIDISTSREDSFEELIKSIFFDENLSRELRVYAFGMMPSENWEENARKIAEELLKEKRDVDTKLLIPNNSIWLNEIVKAYYISVWIVLCGELEKHISHILGRKQMNEGIDNIMSRCCLLESCEGIANAAYQIGRFNVYEWKIKSSMFFGTLAHELGHNLMYLFTPLLSGQMWLQGAMMADLSSYAFFEIMGWQEEKARQREDYRHDHNEVFGGLKRSDEDDLGVDQHLVARAVIEEMWRLFDEEKQRSSKGKVPLFKEILAFSLEHIREGVGEEKGFENLLKSLKNHYFVEDNPGDTMPGSQEDKANNKALPYNGTDEQRQLKKFMTTKFGDIVWKDRSLKTSQALRDAEALQLGDGFIAILKRIALLRDANFEAKKLEQELMINVQRKLNSQYLQPYGLNVNFTINSDEKPLSFSYSLYRIDQVHTFAEISKTRKEEQIDLFSFTPVFFGSGKAKGYFRASDKTAHSTSSTIARDVQNVLTSLFNKTKNETQKVLHDRIIKEWEITPNEIELLKKMAPLRPYQILSAGRVWRRLPSDVLASEVAANPDWATFIDGDSFEIPLHVPLELRETVRDFILKFRYKSITRPDSILIDHLGNQYFDYLVLVDRITKRMHFDTLQHELRHYLDDKLWDYGDRVQEEFSAYLAEMAQGKHTFVILDQFFAQALIGKQNDIYTQAPKKIIAGLVTKMFEAYPISRNRKRYGYIKEDEHTILQALEGEEAHSKRLIQVVQWLSELDGKELKQFAKEVWEDHFNRPLDNYEIIHTQKSKRWDNSWDTMPGSAADGGTAEPFAGELPAGETKPVDDNVTCGTICEEGHQEQLDPQIKEFYDYLKDTADMPDKKILGEEEVAGILDDDSVLHELDIRYEDLEEIIIHVHNEGKIPNDIQILPALPNINDLTQKLWWIDNLNPTEGEPRLYAGGHFRVPVPKDRDQQTRIHISLPLIASILNEQGLEEAKKAALAIANHEYKHIVNRGKKLLDESIRKFKVDVGKKLRNKTKSEPLIVLTKGKPATGKTTIGRSLAAYIKELGGKVHVWDRRGYDKWPVWGSSYRGIKQKFSSYDFLLLEVVSLPLAQDTRELDFFINMVLPDYGIREKRIRERDSQEPAEYQIRELLAASEGPNYPNRKPDYVFNTTYVKEVEISHDPEEDEGMVIVGKAANEAENVLVIGKSTKIEPESSNVDNSGDAMPDSEEEQEEKEKLSAENKDEVFLLEKAAEHLENHHINMRVDLSAIPEDEEQLDKNMETLAYVIAQHNTFDLNIRYILEHDTDGKALDILKGKLRKIPAFAGMTKGDAGMTKGRNDKIDELFKEHFKEDGEEIIEIMLRSLENVDKTELVQDKEFIVGLKDDDTKTGIPIPNYAAAAAIGLLQASLRIGIEGASGRNLGEKFDSAEKDIKRSVLSRIKRIYKRYRIIKTNKDFIMADLKYMVTGCSENKLHYARSYAFPPIEKDLVNRINKYHEIMHGVLQAA